MAYAVKINGETESVLETEPQARAFFLKLCAQAKAPVIISIVAHGRTVESFSYSHKKATR